MGSVLGIFHPTGASPMGMILAENSTVKGKEWNLK